MSSHRNIRQLLLLNAEEDAIIADHFYTQRFASRSDAMRDLLERGMVQAGLMVQREPEPENLTPPTIPTPDECGRPVLGEIILPWLRAQGRRSYTVDEVVNSVFGETANQPGRKQAVTNLFKAIGWAQSQKRDGRTVQQTFTAPDGDA